MFLIVTVKLFATLREGRKKIDVMDLAEGSTPEDILKMLKINISEAAIILINGVSTDLKVVLKDKDVLSIFPPVGGG